MSKVNDNVKEKLEKQLELLSERSGQTQNVNELCNLTQVMVELAKALGLLGFIS